MINIFIKYIEEIYNIILQPIDNEYKKLAILKYKKVLEIENSSFGDYYYKFVQLDREKGVVYTPFEIANYMVKSTVKARDIIQNPYIKIIDPACGSGNIIIPCYKYLLELYEKNLEAINENNNINLTQNTIASHIVKYNLFGFDIDKNALKVLMMDLYSLSGCINKNNFLNKDFLLDNDEMGFDIFISNPPYVGQKSVNREYSMKLKNIYKEVYKDKGDISYCFFQKALININKGGKLAFITSRYFLEAPSGEELRKVLKELCCLEKIVDFYGIRPFKKAGIDPVIVFLTKLQKNESIIEVIKPNHSKGIDKKLFYKSLFLGEGENYKKFFIEKSALNNKGWVLRDEKERKIINKIEKHSFTTLSNICNSYQGIITGCDNAFILDEELIEKENIEKNILRPWIKSSYINKNEIKKGEKFIIYSDFISNECDYKNAIEHIGKYKQRLMNRRECVKGIRKWYGLQWGRDINIFEGKKIIFPYKAEKNRFALDNGSFFSADVYAIRLKENVPFTYEYLLLLLNSKIYEFYFKTFAKSLVKMHMNITLII